MARRHRKFGNRITAGHDGRQMFDSVGEMNRWYELQLLERAGEISDLRRQVKFELQPSFRNRVGKCVRAITWTADFAYREGGVEVVEDFKSPATASEKAFRIKVKMFQFQHPDVLVRVSMRGGRVAEI